MPTKLGEEEDLRKKVWKIINLIQTAREEGFENIAKVFEAIAIAEKQHEKRYNELRENIENGTVFKKKEKTTWRCLNCGYIHDGEEAHTGVEELRGIGVSKAMGDDRPGDIESHADLSQ